MKLWQGGKYALIAYYKRRVKDFREPLILCVPVRDGRMLSATGSWFRDAGKLVLMQHN